MHPLNIFLKFLTLEIFHFDISGNDSIDLQPKNILFISVTLDVFHFDISGNTFNDMHS